MFWDMVGGTGGAHLQIPVSVCRYSISLCDVNCSYIYYTYARYTKTYISVVQLNYKSDTYHLLTPQIPTDGRHKPRFPCGQGVGWSNQEFSGAFFLAGYSTHHEHEKNRYK